MALGPLAGAAAAQLFAFGLFVASVFSATILPLATAFYVCEAFGFEAGIDKRFSEAPQFYVLFTLIILIGVAIILFPGAPLITITIWTQVLNAILLPMVLICMMIIVNKTEVMENYTNNRLQNIVGWSTSIILILLSAFLLYTGSGLG
jgi:Mn2+/Fe2+ NRAMP family transporter